MQKGSPGKPGLPFCGGGRVAGRPPCRLQRGEGGKLGEELVVLLEAFLGALALLVPRGRDQPRATIHSGQNLLAPQETASLLRQIGVVMGEKNYVLHCLERLFMLANAHLLFLTFP